MANQIKAPINYPIIAGGKIVSGGSVLFGQPNVKPDEDNPSTLKAIYLDAALSQQAENPQGISSDGVFDQSDTGILYGPTDTVYSIVIRGANKKELSYIPEYDLSDSNAAQAAQDAAAAAASSESNAIAAKDLTEALYTDFTNRYFGAYSADPSVDAQDNTPNEGSLYWNSTASVFKIWASGAWETAQIFTDFDDALITATGTTTPRSLADWTSKETLTYNNIAEAKADTALDTGQSVKTLGHYSAGDGGGDKYIVVAGGTGTDDGGSYHDMTNGNQLELIILDELDVRSLGIRADVDMASSIVSANSISERSGVPLVFTEGNYHSTENLEFTEAINWRGVGAVEISIEEDAGTGIIVSGTKKSSISLSSNINIWDSIITVNTTAGVEVGDLIAIKGTEQFYGVSALYMGGDINKGHLCKVIDVVSATQIEVEVAISDSYAIGNVSEIEVWTPITGLHLDNITFRKSNVSSSASVMTHLYCDSPLVSRCKFTGAKGIGFMFETCYKAVCKDTFGEGAINLYQFRDEGSYGTLYSKVTGRKAGKIIDLSGFSIPCRDARIVDCEDFNSEDSFGLGTGFGSHWGCEGAIWENCTTRDRFRGFSQRGITEKFINCHVFGACAQSAFQIENPKDVLIKSCTYNSQLLPDREGGTDTFKSETSSKISDLPPSFLVVISNDGSNKCSGFTVEDCEAYGITNRFVEFFTASTEYFGFTIKDNDVYVINSGAANDISIMDTTDTTCTVYDFVSENNTLRTNEGQTNVYNLGVSLSTVIRETLGKPSILEAPKTQKMYLLKAVHTIHNYCQTVKVGQIRSSLKRLVKYQIYHLRF